jgi:hypothetical protein
MLKKIYVAAALLAGLQTNALANVVYTWVTVNSSPEKSPLNPKISLVFTDEAVASGRVSFHYRETNPAVPGGDLAELHFQTGSLPITFSSDVPFGPSQGNRYVLDGSFGITSDGFLAGSLAVNDGQTDFSMSSVGTLFTFDHIASDAPIDESCAPWDRDCGGATGYFHETFRYTVPEPGSIALLLIGALGAVGTCRRSKS